MRKTHLYDQDDSYLRIAEKTDESYKALVNELYEHLRSDSNSYLGLDLSINQVVGNMSLIKNTSLAVLLKEDLQKKMDDEMKGLRIEK